MLLRIGGNSGLIGSWTLSMLSIPKNTKKHNVSGTGSVSVLRRGRGRHILCWVRQKEDGNGSSFREVVFLRIPDDGQIPKTN
jgi:hypothetical protein